MLRACFSGSFAQINATANAQVRGEVWKVKFRARGLLVQLTHHLRNWYLIATCHFLKCLPENIL